MDIGPLSFGAKLRVLVWDHDGADLEFLTPVHSQVCRAWHLSSFSISCTRRSFGLDLCGPACVAFFLYHLGGFDLPATQEQLQVFAHQSRLLFIQTCDNSAFVPRPWCWGTGVQDPMPLLVALLQAHGVPTSQSTSRAKLILQSLGNDNVLRAVTGTAPWRSLKSIADQQTPKLQLVLPDEIQQVKTNQVEASEKAPPRGRKNKQNTWTRPPASVAKPADLDPSKLVLGVNLHFRNVVL